MNEIKFKELYIFGIQAGKNGQNTLEFYDGAVANVSDDERLIFEYKSKSTGEVRKAMFFKANISGFSYT